MAKVFPENMNPVSTGDPKAALVTLDNYVRYMQERIEFTISRLKGSGADVSLTELSAELAEIKDQIGIIASTLAQI